MQKGGNTPGQTAYQGALVRQAEANLATQEAAIKQAQAALQNTQAQLDKNSLRAPFDGLVAKQEAKVGEMAAANTTIVSLISEAKFEIEANVPEADIAKVKISDSANVTLDAYGNEVIFEARVVAIEPAETVIDGVATYKNTFQFVKEDERIKSGMTANIDILTDQRENVIIVPQRAVINQGNGKIIKVLGDDQVVKDVQVETGLRGSDGNIEIISGLNEGDKVVVNFK